MRVGSTRRWRRGQMDLARDRDQRRVGASDGMLAARMCMGTLLECRIPRADSGSPAGIGVLATLRRGLYKCVDGDEDDRGLAVERYGAIFEIAQGAGAVGKGHPADGAFLKDGAGDFQSV